VTLIPTLTQMCSYCSYAFLNAVWCSYCSYAHLVSEILILSQSTPRYQDFEGSHNNAYTGDGDLPVLYRDEIRCSYITVATKITTHTLPQGAAHGW
jgi:hypothetical protein